MTFCHLSGDVPVPINEEYSITRVADEKALTKWGEIAEEAFNMPPGSSTTAMGPASPFLFSETSECLLFILKNVDQTPIACSQLYLPQEKTRPAGHYCWGTLNAHRKKGAMSHMVETMLNIVHERGHERSVAQCYDSSVRLAEKIGFTAHGTLDVYIKAQQS